MQPDLPHWKSRLPPRLNPCTSRSAHHQIFQEGFRPADPKTGHIPPSVIHRAFLEHCKKREIVPKEIVDEYNKVLDGVLR
jgi:hypothetical protein